VYEKNGDGLYTVKPGSVVARVVSTEAGYGTLQEALANAEDNDTVQLVSDVEENVGTTKTLTLDLGTKTLTAKSDSIAAITNSGSLTLKNGTVRADNGVAFENIGEAVLDKTVSVYAKAAFEIKHTENVNSKLSVNGGVYYVTEKLITDDVANESDSVTFADGTFAICTVTGEGPYVPALNKADGEFVDRNLFPDNMKANIKVSGGKYSHAVDSQYWAAGKRVAEIEEESEEIYYLWYTVVNMSKFALSLSTNDSTAPNAVTGAGRYVEGEQVTVVATAGTGYNFAGWYANDVLVSTSANYTFPMPASRYALVAFFTQSSESVATVLKLEVTAPKFTITGIGLDGIDQTHIYSDATIGTEYTVKYTGTEKFLYWQNGNRRIVSRSETYSFKLATDTVLMAVTTNTDLASREVRYLNYSDQLLYAAYYNGETSKENIYVPAAPYYLGASFLGWCVNGGDYIATEEQLREEIHALLSADEKPDFIELTPYYEVDNAPVNVLITLIDKDGNTVTTADGADHITANGKIGYNSITLSESKVPNGMFIQYWLADGVDIRPENALSKNNTVKIRITSAEQIKLRVVVDTTQGVIKPTAAVQDLYSFYDGVKHLAFLASFNIPEGFTIIEKGLFRAQNDNNAAHMTIGTYAANGITKIVAQESGSSTYAYTLNLKSAASQTSTWSFRAYIVYSYTNEHGETVTEEAYSPVATGNYDTMTPRTSTNP
jgi:hypothetical protein